MGLKAININSSVKVRITEFGEEIRKRHYRFYKLSAPDIKVDEFGYSKWQLWELMNVFGTHTSLGGLVCFETTILINEKDIEDVPIKIADYHKKGEVQNGRGRKTGTLLSRL